MGELGAWREVDLVDGHAVEERAHQHGEHHDGEHDGAEGREPVTPEAPPGVGRERLRRETGGYHRPVEHRPGSRPVGHGAHLYEIRGSSQP
jgi:hypothetical protein